MGRVDGESGFTMIELLFVIAVIGAMLAVIAPRAYRANIDSKYGVVRQGAVELVSYATEWANQGLASQDHGSSTSDLNAYIASLAGGNPPAAGIAQWIADDTDPTNWNNRNTSTKASISGRNGAVNAVPETTIQETIPGIKIPVNPFNGANVFSEVNDPSYNHSSVPGGPLVYYPVTGALACAGIDETVNGWHYYALIFQGTDSTTVDPALGSTFYAGQSPATIAGLRNGIFLGRER